MKQIVKYGFLVVVSLLLLWRGEGVTGPESQFAGKPDVPVASFVGVSAVPFTMWDDVSGEMFFDLTSSTSVEKYFFVCQICRGTFGGETFQRPLSVRFFAPFSLPDAAYVFGLHEIIV